METSNLELSLSPRGVLRVLLNRPARFNAFDEALIAALTAAFERAAADPAVRVLVLAGAGRHFCAGADIAWMQRAATLAAAANEADAARFAAMLAALADCPKPTLARVQGLALAGGVGLVCACDIALAESGAQFGVSEALLGLLPAVIAPYLINAVGLRAARMLGLSAQRLDAAAALRCGLVHEVGDDLDAAESRWVDALLSCAPGAQAELKHLFASWGPGPVTPERRALGAQTLARVRRGAEAGEGLDAFVARRRPNWREDNKE